jgi:hypothetical protein
MTPVYIDACALMLVTESHTAGCTARSSSLGPIIEAVIDDRGNEVAMSSLTLTEFQNTAARKVRSTSPEDASCNAAWSSDAVLGVMRRVADGGLRVIDRSERIDRQAAMLTHLAARDHRRAFKVWDAVHLLTAASWAHAAGTEVELLTADSDFDNFVALYPRFGTFVRVRNVDKEANL